MFKCGEWGNAPLHSTAALCDVSDAQQMALIELLLDYGADPMQRNNVQQLPFDLVPPHRHQVNLLQSIKIQFFNIQSNNSTSPTGENASDDTGVT